MNLTNISPAIIATNVIVTDSVREPAAQRFYRLERFLNTVVFRQLHFAIFPLSILQKSPIPVSCWNSDRPLALGGHR